MKRGLILTVVFSAVLLFQKPCFAQIFVGFDEFCHIPVVVMQTGQGAVAGRDSFGNPVIYVDPGVYGNWTSSRKFALAHECGHHVLGHTTPQGLWARNWASREQELSADCWAGKQLASIMDMEDLKRQLSQFASQGPIPWGPYPSGWERARVAAQCAGIDLQRKGKGNAPSRNKWQYEYSLLNSNRWSKSSNYSSKEACEKWQSKKNESPRYSVTECEEVEQ